MCKRERKIKYETNISNTPEYQEIKKHKRQQYRLQHANILGTTEHEKVARNLNLGNDKPLKPEILHS